MGTCQNKEAHHEHEEFRLDSQKIKSPEAL